MLKPSDLPEHLVLRGGSCIGIWLIPLAHTCPVHAIDVTSGVKSMRGISRKQTPKSGWSQC